MKKRTTRIIKYEKVEVKGRMSRSSWRRMRGEDARRPSCLGGECTQGMLG